MQKILLVDGSNLLFQMFFGMPARIINEQGKAIQGTLGFVGALLKIIRRISPTHVAVLFDGESHNPRVDLDADYKSNREDYSQVAEEENPFSQLPDIYDALDFLGICHAETEDCETDDWMAGYVKKYTAMGADAVFATKIPEIVISSFDSDFFQLISDKVTVFRYRGENSVLCDRAYLQDKFGIIPERYADFKSLTGDTADNIKGADKVGPKTAAQLVNDFGSLEEILARAEVIKKPSVRESVKQNAERLRKNYRLIKLTGVENLPFALNEMRWEDSGITTNEVLKGIGLK
ncbi:MAG: flap endonuclease [Lachnospiraceae bacterium]|nr:flap endonuclease [Lachnospiraceae bacterium]